VIGIGTVAVRARSRPGRTGLFLGLVFLVTVHIGQGVHSASFTGPHLGAAIVAETHRSADGAHGLGLDPEHHHHPGEHIDHTVDRPRASTDTTAAAGPGHISPASDPPCTAAQAVAVLPDIHRARAPDTDTDPADPAGPGILALHCVRRQ
jgi:hypothetical protein